MLLLHRAYKYNHHLYYQQNVHQLWTHIKTNKQKQKEKADDENNQLFVFFPEDEKVGVKPIKILTDRMKDENVSNAILVLRGDITPFAKQAVLEMSDSFRIEHFKEAELLVDITEHTLVSIF